MQCLSALPPVDNGPSCVPARILGKLAHHLPTLPPVDNQPWARTCTYTSASWRRITGVASCCQTALDMYLHTCFGELAQHLPALHPIDNRLQLVSVELARRLPALHAVDTRPNCVPTHILGRACSPPTDIASCRQPAMDVHVYPGKLAQACECCLLSTSSPGHLPVHMLR